MLRFCFVNHRRYWNGEKVTSQTVRRHPSFAVDPALSHLQDSQPVFAPQSTEVPKGPKCLAEPQPPLAVCRFLTSVCGCV